MFKSQIKIVENNIIVGLSLQPTLIFSKRKKMERNQKADVMKIKWEENCKIERQLN